MKWLLSLALCLASMATAASALGADDPSGTWKYSQDRNGKVRESTVTLKLEGDKLTGHVPGRNNTVTVIENGTYKDGELSFTVTRERNGVKFTIKYSGKLSGDTITGKVEFERDGKTESRDWVAKRAL
jgi:hypothetical protein